MYLLDTNALLILLYNQLTNAELTEVTAEIMYTERKLYVSIVSLWEMAMKMQVSKLNLGKSIGEVKPTTYLLRVSKLWGVFSFRSVYQLRWIYGTILVEN